MIARPKAKLLRNYITRSGDLYNPRVYEENELPEYLYQLEDSTLLQILKPNQTEKRITPVDTSVINLSSEYSKSKEKEFTTEIKSQVVEPELEEVTLTNINTATREELIALPRIGAKTADNIIKARNMSPFLSMSDLKERIEILGNWNTYQLDF
jgi:DNA uptake protein ComE-like DNA-binding protein